MELETLKLIIEIAGGLAIAIYWFRKKNLEEGAKALASIFDDAVALAETDKKKDGNAKAIMAESLVAKAIEVPAIKKRVRKFTKNMDTSKIRQAIKLAHQARKSGIKQTLKRNFLSKII